MPAFGELLDQKAARAIRTHIEPRPGEGEIDPYTQRLAEIMDVLKAGTDVDSDALRVELAEIAAKIPTGSGTPVADIIASGWIEFAIYDDFAPYSWLDKGQPRGTDIDVGRLIAKALGIAARFSFVQADENLDADLQN